MIDIEDKADVKPTPIKGGWWQNVYVLDKGINAGPGCGWTKMDDGRWMWSECFPTRDIAETNKDSPSSGECFCYIIDKLYGGNLFVWDDSIHFKGDA